MTMAEDEVLQFLSLDAQPQVHKLLCITEEYNFATKVTHFTMQQIISL